MVGNIYVYLLEQIHEIILILVLKTFVPIDYLKKIFF